MAHWVLPSLFFFPRSSSPNSAPVPLRVSSIIRSSSALARSFFPSDPDSPSVKEMLTKNRVPLGPGHSFTSGATHETVLVVIVPPLLADETLAAEPLLIPATHPVLLHDHWVVDDGGGDCGVGVPHAERYEPHKSSSAEW